MASTTREEVRRAISLYFTKLRSVKPILRGVDLQKMEIQPGPVFREILDSLLDARLNGALKTRQDEISFVQKHWETACRIIPH
jgi:tRNA nucleotidyltransferase (CCA-adding enzyme)